MKIGIKQITALILLALLMEACASSKPKGMRKSRKKNCDCPSFSTLHPFKQNPNTFIAFNGKEPN